jgi:hypothetical protein
MSTAYLARAKSMRKYFRLDKGFSKLRADRAFVNWYVEARFGKIHSDDFLNADRAHDGGIDAVVTRAGEVFVLQMKYEVVPRLSTLGDNEILKFEKVRAMFTQRTKQKEYEKWLENVREDLRAQYNAVRELTLSKRTVTRFILVTTKRSLRDKTTIEIEDYKRILTLWDLYEEGFTPTTDKLTLKLDQQWTVKDNEKKFFTIVGLADVSQIRSAMKLDQHERLFARNIRTGLATKINSKIRATFEKEPETFWLGNNGVYIVCHEIERIGKKYKLIYPSVINGYQTLTSIHKSPKNKHCHVLIRILKTDSFSGDSLLSNVISRTNTQNPIKPRNLRAHDPFVLNLAKYLDQYKVYLERRENEWKGIKKNHLGDRYQRVGFQELTQWLSTRHPTIGLGTARNQPKDLFDLDLPIFESIYKVFDKTRDNENYGYVGPLVWSGLFIKNLIKQIGSDGGRSRAEIAQLLLIKACQEVTTVNSGLSKDIINCLMMMRMGREHIPKDIVHFFEVVVSDLNRQFKVARRKNDALDFTNFFKDDKLTKLAYRRVFSPRKKSTLKTLLRERLSLIE